jgi:hypothetical protein
VLHPGQVRPIEHKLKYQVEKYVAMAETGEARWGPRAA